MGDEQKFMYAEGIVASQTGIRIRVLSTDFPTQMGKLKTSHNTVNLYSMLCAPAIDQESP